MCQPDIPNVCTNILRYLEFLEYFDKNRLQRRYFHFSTFKSVNILYLLTFHPSMCWLDNMLIVDLSYHNQKKTYKHTYICAECVY